MQQRIKAVLRLREMILDGELAAGSRLSEPMLAELIQVSRTPVRVALVQLEHEGLLELLPGGGYRIRVFAEKDIFDAIELRGTYEGLCARYAAESGASALELERLAGHISSIDEVLENERLSEGDFLRYMEINQQLHDCVVDMAHSPMLAEAMNRIVTLPFASPSAFVLVHAEIPESRHVLTIAQHQHHSLYEAIAAGEGSRAEAIAREHARSAKRNLQIVLRQQDAMDRVPGLQLIKRG